MLNMSENIINDTYKIANVANKELTKIKDNKSIKIINKLNNEIQLLVQRKDFTLRYKKELTAKEKILRLREKLLSKKKNLQHKVNQKNNEYSIKTKELEANIFRADSEFRTCQHKLTHAINEDEQHLIKKDLVKISEDKANLEKDKNEINNDMKLQTSFIQDQIIQCEYKLKG